MDYLKFLIVFYGAYMTVSLVISVMQIGYVRRALGEQAVLLDEAAYRKAGAYAILKEKLALASTLIDGIVTAVWIGGGLAWMLAAIPMSDPLWRAVVATDLFFAVGYVTGLPLEIVRTFVVDARYGFTTATPALFAADQLKKVVLFAVFGSGLIAALVWIVTHVAMWWMWGFVLVFGVSAFVAMMYPTLIAPIFNRFVPLPEGELKSRITQMLTRYGFAADGVFSIDAGKRDTRLNAYFGGLGRSKRIALYDTLIAKLSVDEIVAVLGHELGHASHGDLYRQLAATGAMLLSFFYVFGHLPDALFGAIGVTTEAAALVPIAIVLMTPLSFFVMPLVAAVSRHNEFAADRFGAQAGGKEHLAAALIKLVSENLAFPRAHPLYRLFYHTHPTVPERLERLA